MEQSCAQPAKTDFSVLASTIVLNARRNVMIKVILIVCVEWETSFYGVKMLKNALLMYAYHHVLKRLQSTVTTATVNCVTYKVDFNSLKTAVSDVSSPIVLLARQSTSVALVPTVLKLMKVSVSRIPARLR